MPPAGSGSSSATTGRRSTSAATDRKIGLRRKPGPRPCEAGVLALANAAEGAVENMDSGHIDRGIRRAACRILRLDLLLSMPAAMVIHHVGSAAARGTSMCSGSRAGYGREI